MSPRLKITALHVRGIHMKVWCESGDGYRGVRVREIFNKLRTERETDVLRKVYARTVSMEIHRIGLVAYTRDSIKVAAHTCTCRREVLTASRSRMMVPNAKVNTVNNTITPLSNNRYRPPFTITR